MDPKTEHDDWKNRINLIFNLMKYFSKLRVNLKC